QHSLRPLRWAQPRRDAWDLERILPQVTFRTVDARIVVRPDHGFTSGDFRPPLAVLSLRVPSYEPPMPLGHDVDFVLAHYPEGCWPERCQALGNAGGFSGARLLRIDAELGTLCLRRWPAEHPAPEGLEFIQAVL